MINLKGKTVSPKKFLCAVLVFVLGALPRNADAQNAIAPSPESKILFSRDDTVVLKTQDGTICSLVIGLQNSLGTLLYISHTGNGVRIASIDHWSPGRYPPTGSYASVRVMAHEQLFGTGEGKTIDTSISTESSLKIDELAHLFRSQNRVTFEFWGDGGRFGSHHIDLTNPVDVLNTNAAFHSLRECAEE